MTLPHDKSAAVVVLPPVSGDRLRDTALKNWIARGDVRPSQSGQELLHYVLGAIGRPCSDSGLAALRMWGQTGDRPNVWIAAADPVYLEPRLDHLRLHSIGPTVPASQLSALLDHLQLTLVDSANYGFARVGPFGYLRATEPMPTADVPPHLVDQCVPSEFMPSGEEAQVYNNLIGEVEMALHDHEVNLRRQEEGLRPVNCLWFWGGGHAPEKQTVPHPPLFANNPMLKGYWLSNTAVVDTWPGSIGACLEASVAGFVAMPDIATTDTCSIETCLRELHGALDSKRVTQVHLLFTDGMEARLRRSNRLRIWRSGTKKLD